MRGGLPHSEISGSTVARTSPELFAACHVLHRLSVPRHSPDALLIELAHAQPQARARAQAAPRAVAPLNARAEGRRQNAERSQRCCPLPSDRCPLKPMRKHHRCSRIGVLHTHAPAQPDGTAGPASRSRLASRCQRTDGRGQRTVVRRLRARRADRPRLDAETSPTSARHSDDRFSRCPTSTRDAKRQLEMPNVNRRAIADLDGPGQTPAPSVIRHQSSDIGAAAAAGGPGPTRTADLTLIRRAL
jgi:hypothetical protein